MIMSISMMLSYTLDLPKAGEALKNAVTEVLKDGYRTADIYREGNQLVGTTEMRDLVIEKLAKTARAAGSA